MDKANAPLIGTEFQVLPSGAMGSYTEYDTFGGEIKIEPPTPTTPPDWLYAGTYSSSGNPFDGNGGCLENGFPQDCAQVVRLACHGNPRCMGDGRTKGFGYILGGFSVKSWKGKSGRVAPRLPADTNGADDQPIVINQQGDGGIWINSFLPVSFIRQQQVGQNINSFIIQDNPCLLMAANLGMYIANKIKSLGGNEKITTHQQIDSLVGSVNSDFTNFYVGKEVTDSQGAIPPDPPFGGAGGFKPGFIDSIDPNEDQTHHFAGYFNAGILGRSWAALAHKWGTDRNNENDRALGDLAYSMGASLNKMFNETIDRTTNPRFPLKKKNDEPVNARLKRVLGIADRVRNEICGN